MSSSVVVIKPSKKIQFIDFKEIWEYRELLFTFVKRDLQVRYRQTVIGGLWAIMQPLTTMIVFSFFFGKLAGISGAGVPYPVFSYAGLILWTYFTAALTTASSSMVASSALITKVYFPRIIIPIAATITPIVDYFLAGTVLICLLVYYQIIPPAIIILLPLITILAWMLAMGMSFWLSALNVKYRDIGFVLPFFIQLMLFVTPVIYPSSIAPNFKNILALNPMTGIMDAHRNMILGSLPVDWMSLLVSIILVLIIFFTGSAYFKSVERYFADII